MSESHQPSIKTFFQAPKRPRRVIEPNSDSDNWEDRPLSKSTRLDSLKQQEDESKDSDDLYEPIGVGNRVEHTSSNDAQNPNPTPINGSSSTTGTSRSNPRVFPWKSEYKELFNWLDYDPIKGEARCSYRAGLAIGRTVSGLCPCPDPTDRSRYQNPSGPIRDHKGQGHAWFSPKPTQFEVERSGTDPGFKSGT